MCDRLVSLLSACLRASKKAKLDAANIVDLANAFERRDYAAVAIELAKHWQAYDSYDALSKSAVDQIVVNMNSSLE